MTGRLRCVSTHGPSGRADSAPTAVAAAASADTPAGPAPSTATAISGNAPKPTAAPRAEAA